MKKLVFVAGDISGDFYAGALSKKLKELYQDRVSIYSFGGPNLKKYSHQVINLTDYAVSGIFEVVGGLKRIYSTFKKTIKEIKNIAPHLVILVDFPEFNLRLAKKLRSQFNILYYISPQVWAWREKRIEFIKKYTDKIIVLFEFEEKLYRERGADVLYFGHPLLDIIENRNVSKEKLILLLPGSRKNEIKRHLPIMIEAKTIIEKKLKNWQFAIVRPPNVSKSFYKTLISEKIEIIDHSYQALSKAKFAITSSGTATLEIATLGIPSLIMYKVNFLSWLILRKLVKIKFIGMPNIIAGKKIIEEFVQAKALPHRIASYTISVLTNEGSYQKIKRDLEEVKKRLAPYGALENTAKFIATYLNL
ncbi:MAG: lipid-A-disaccharide synthase [Candidatus Omnitrophota bacterium]|nr:MAG: lipid-A-disaccharide synthase [Candidatus Omnitrophota bacterium]